MTEDITGGSEDEAKIVQLHPGRAAGRVYETTIVDNTRRYRQNECKHRGPYIIDMKLAAVECGDCGSYLNPLFVLEQLSHREAYWNMRQRDLATHLATINKEIEGRSRTKCTHCGNMTAIKFNGEMPRTWVSEPY